MRSVLKNSTLRLARFSLLIFIIIIAAAACGRDEDQTNKQITYRLKWLYNISVVGDLYANVQGYFTEQGLKVDIKSGGPERDALKELELGRAQFGVASADQVIRAIDKGAPIVVIAQLFQINPLHWLYRADADSGQIMKPEQLKDKVIGITHGGNDETIMHALLVKNGISTNAVEFFSVRYDYTPFYRHQVNLWPIYRNAEGVVIADKLRKEGEECLFFNPAEFGIRFVANSVVTTRELLENNPKTVQKFLRALLRGWQEALSPANTINALNVMQEFDKDTSLRILQTQLDATRDLMVPPPGTSFGSIDVAAWQQTEKIMLEQKLISAPVSIEKYLYQPEKISAKIKRSRLFPSNTIK